MRVVIAEDLFLLRDGLTRMLEAHGLEIAAAVDNGSDLQSALIPSRIPTWPSWMSGCRQPSPTKGCGPRWPRGVSGQGLRCWCCLSMSSSCTPASCSPTAPAASVTCSRTGSSTAPSLWRQ